MKKLKTRDEWLNEGHSYDNEIEKARMMQGSASDLVEWATRKIAESRPENFKEGVISPVQEAKESYKIMRLVNGRTKEMIEGTIGEIMDQFSKAMDKLRDSGSGKQFKDDPKTAEELVKYLNAAQSYIEKKDNPKNTYEIKESELYEFMVKKLDKKDNFDWEFEINDPGDKKLYKALTDAGIEFGTANGKLAIMGDGNTDNAVPAIRILHKFGIKESVNEARKPITKKHWDKADDDQRVDWLLQAFSDPDDAEKYFDYDWNDLPPQATSNMYESLDEADDNWSDDVKTKWTPPKGLFTEPANKIADVLHKESDDLDQAMSRLQFYINRGGKLLDGKAKANLETAKKLLQQKYK